MKTSAPPLRSINPAFVLLLTTFLLSAFGLLFVFEASVSESFSTFGHPYHFISRQLMWFGVGIVTLLIGYVLPLKIWRAAAWPLYVVALMLLIAVWIPGLGSRLNGAHRWIFIGGFSFQSVELMKLSLVVLFASWMTTHHRLVPFLFLTGLPALLVLLQPDMGSLLILLGIAFGMYFVAGGEWKHLGMIAGGGVLLLAIAILLAPYRLQRVTTFFNPELDPQGSSFHIRQITLALGNGGLFGQGIGNSRQKYAYIPEVSTDSIFAVVAEEIGFVGSAVLIGLFALYFFSSYKLIRRVPNGSFGQLLGMGILIWIMVQTILNLSAVVALVPLTGIPLPFISYGGSSLMMIFMATGLTLQLSRHRTSTKASAS